MSQCLICSRGTSPSLMSGVIPVDKCLISEDSRYFFSLELRVLWLETSISHVNSNVSSMDTSVSFLEKSLETIFA